MPITFAEISAAVSPHDAVGQLRFIQELPVDELKGGITNGEELVALFDILKTTKIKEFVVRQIDRPYFLTLLTSASDELKAKLLDHLTDFIVAQINYDYESLSILLAAFSADRLQKILVSRLRSRAAIAIINDSSKLIEILRILSNSIETKLILIKCLGLAHFSALLISSAPEIKKQFTEELIKNRLQLIQIIELCWNPADEPVGNQLLEVLGWHWIIVLLKRIDLSLRGTFRRKLSENLDRSIRNDLEALYYILESYRLSPAPGHYEITSQQRVIDILGFDSFVTLFTESQLELKLEFFNTFKGIEVIKSYDQFIYLLSLLPDDSAQNNFVKAFGFRRFITLLQTCSLEKKWELIVRFINFIKEYSNGIMLGNVLEILANVTPIEGAYSAAYKARFIELFSADDLQRIIENSTQLAHLFSMFAEKSEQKIYLIRQLGPKFSSLLAREEDLMQISEALRSLNNSRDLLLVIRCLPHHSSSQGLLKKLGFVWLDEMLAGVKGRYSGLFDALCWELTTRPFETSADNLEILINILNLVNTPNQQLLISQLTPAQLIELLQESSHELRINFIETFRKIKVFRTGEMLQRFLITTYRDSAEDRERFILALGYENFIEILKNSSLAEKERLIANFKFICLGHSTYENLFKLLEALNEDKDAEAIAIARLINSFIEDLDPVSIRRIIDDGTKLAAVLNILTDSLPKINFINKLNQLNENYVAMIIFQARDEDKLVRAALIKNHGDLIIANNYLPPSVKAKLNLEWLAILHRSVSGDAGTELSTLIRNCSFTKIYGVDLGLLSMLLGCVAPLQQQQLLNAMPFEYFFKLFSISSGRARVHFIKTFQPITLISRGENLQRLLEVMSDLAMRDQLAQELAYPNLISLLKNSTLEGFSFLLTTIKDRIMMGMYETTFIELLTWPAEIPTETIAAFQQALVSIMTAVDLQYIITAANLSRILKLIPNHQVGYNLLKTLNWNYAFELIKRVSAEEAPLIIARLFNTGKEFITIWQELIQDNKEWLKAQSLFPIQSIIADIDIADGEGFSDVLDILPDTQKIQLIERLADKLNGFINSSELFFKILRIATGAARKLILSKLLFVKISHLTRDREAEFIHLLADDLREFVNNKILLIWLLGRKNIETVGSRLSLSDKRYVILTLGPERFKTLWQAITVKEKLLSYTEFFDLIEGGEISEETQNSLIDQLGVNYLFGILEDETILSDKKLFILKKLLLVSEYVNDEDKFKLLLYISSVDKPIDVKSRLLTTFFDRFGADIVRLNLSADKLVTVLTSLKDEKLKKQLIFRLGDAIASIVQTSDQFEKVICAILDRQQSNRSLEGRHLSIEIQQTLLFVLAQLGDRIKTLLTSDNILFIYRILPQGIDSIFLFQFQAEAVYLDVVRLMISNLGGFVALALSLMMGEEWIIKQKAELKKKAEAAFLELLGQFIDQPAIMTKLLNLMIAREDDFLKLFFYQLIKKFKKPLTRTLIENTVSFIELVGNERAKDQYFFVCQAILAKDEALLEFSLQAELNDSSYFIQCFELAINEAAPIGCINLLLNDSRFNLYGRLANGETLENFINSQEIDEHLKETYLAALNSARENLKLKAPFNLVYREPIKFDELPEDLYADISRRPCNQEAETIDWFRVEETGRSIIGEEPRFRLAAIIAYLKNKLGVGAREVATKAAFDALAANFLGTGGMPILDRRILSDVLVMLERVTIIASKIEDSSKLCAWLNSAAEQLAACQAGVVEVLQSLLRVHPLQSAQPIAEFYESLRQMMNGGLARLLHEARYNTDEISEELQEDRQLVHAHFHTAYQLAGLSINVQKRDPFQKSLISVRNCQSLADHVFFEAGGVASFVSVMLALIKEKLAAYRENWVALSSDVALEIFNIAFEQLKPLGFTDPAQLLETNEDEGYKVKLRSDAELVAALKTVRLISYTPNEEENLKNNIKKALTLEEGCFTRDGSVLSTKITDIFTAALQQSGGLAVIVRALLDLSTELTIPREAGQPSLTIYAERLFYPIPGHSGQNLLGLIAADPIWGPELLAGHRFLTPREWIASGKRRKTEPVTTNLVSLIGQLSQDLQSKLTHQALFTPGGLRTALMILQTDRDRQPLLGIFDKLALAYGEQKEKDRLQFVGMEYSGSFISYLLSCLAVEEKRADKKLTQLEMITLKSFLETFTSPEHLVTDKLFVSYLQSLIFSNQNNKAKELLLAESAIYRDALYAHSSDGLRNKVLISLGPEFIATLVTKESSVSKMSMYPVYFWSLLITNQLATVKSKLLNESEYRQGLANCSDKKMVQRILSALISDQAFIEELKIKILSDERLNSDQQWHLLQYFYTQALIALIDNNRVDEARALLLGDGSYCKGLAVCTDEAKKNHILGALLQTADPEFITRITVLIRAAELTLTQKHDLLANCYLLNLLTLINKGQTEQAKTLLLGDDKFYNKYLVIYSNKQISGEIIAKLMELNDFIFMSQLIISITSDRELVKGYKWRLLQTCYVPILLGLIDKSEEERARSLLLADGNYLKALNLYANQGTANTIIAKLDAYAPMILNLITSNQYELAKTLLLRDSNYRQGLVLFSGDKREVIRRLALDEAFMVELRAMTGAGEGLLSLLLFSASAITAGRFFSTAGAAAPAVSQGAAITAVPAAIAGLPAEAASAASTEESRRSAFAAAAVRRAALASQGAAVPAGSQGTAAVTERPIGGFSAAAARAVGLSAAGAAAAKRAAAAVTHTSVPSPGEASSRK